MSRFVSILSFLFLFAIGAHITGLYSAYFGGSTYTFFQSSVRAIEAQSKIEDSRVPPDLLKKHMQRKVELNGSRFNFLKSDGQNIIVHGGIGSFKELCGGEGCLAVSYDRSGKVIQKWPLKIEEIAFGDALSNGKYAYRGSDIASDFSVNSIQTFSNGDLLASFILRNSFPYGWGFARISKNGDVLWRHRDFYHHWPKITADDKIYAPYYEIRQGQRYVGKQRFGRPFAICEASKKQYADSVRKLSSDGKIEAKIDLLDLFLSDERYNFILSGTVDRCDPLHLNFVDVAEASDVGSVDWLKKGDIVVSLRNPSAIAIIDNKGSRIKRVYVGSFVSQHSAQFSGNGKLVLLDNMGSSPEALPSRIIELDIETGAERIVYSRDVSDTDFSEFTAAAGNLDLSHDNKRLLVSYSGSGRVIEIDVASGTKLSEYENAHTWSPERAKPELFRIGGAWYLPE